MEQRRLLLAVPEIALAFQPLEFAEGRRGVLVETVGDGLAKHHCHVLDLVSVDPGQDLGPAGVSGAVGDPVQGVKMNRFLFPRFVCVHPDALWTHR
uniref:Uncharacterized protein n=1 Tax=Echeneis naucrates TaxID=173247 RepID=A0A665UST1_ECHNA